MGGSVIFGMTFGAVSGGLLMRIGRRRSMFVSLFIGIIGNMLSINIQFLPLLIIGRVLYGYAAGLYSSIVPKMFMETVPNHLYSVVMASFCCA